MPDSKRRKMDGKYGDGGLSLCNEISAKSELTMDELLPLPTAALEELISTPTREKLADVKQRRVGRVDG